MEYDSLVILDYWC